MRLSHIARGAASAERGRRLMELRGMTPNGHPLWQQWEVSPLVEMHPKYGSIFPLLDRRTHPAVYSKAGRLGIATPRVPWSDNDLLRLRIYRTGTKAEILAAFPGRSWPAIARQARKRGHNRAKAPEPVSGIRLIDQIYLRAADQKLSLTELDRLGGKAGYFSRRRWRTNPDHAVHYRAVLGLGGHLRAAFSDWTVA